MRQPPLLLLVFAGFQVVACGEPQYGGVVTGKDTGTVWTTTGEDSDDTQTDTVDDDGDLDDDGFSEAEGDCDDDDVSVSPVREEAGNDGKDNDCDGRVDEAWSGVDVGYTNPNGAAEILTLNIIGEIDATVEVGDSCQPYWMDHYLDGWLINNNYAEVAYVDRDGDCTALADFSDTETYEYGVWGVAVGLDGTLYATTLGALWAIDLAGNVDEVASWGFDLEELENHEAAIAAIAVDPLTGELGLFDYFGGFATWSETDGFNLILRGDPEEALLTTMTGAAMDGGGWYIGGTDAATGDYGIYRFDDARNPAWVLEQPWDSSEWTPMIIAANGDNGDFYLSTNGGWYSAVWQIDASNGAENDFLPPLGGTEPDHSFTGLVSNY